MRYASIAILFLASTLSAAMYETRSPHHLLTLDRVVDGSYDVKLMDTDTSEVLASAHLAPTNPPAPMESASELRDMRITLRVSPSPLDLDKFREFVGPTTKREKFTGIMDDNMLREYLDTGRRIVLTDDYAPVDNLVARLFVERGF